MSVKVTAVGKNEVEGKDHGARKETQNQACMDRRIEIKLDKMKNTFKTIAK